MEALSPGKATLSQQDPDIIYPTDAKISCDPGVVYVDTSAVLSEVPDADRDQHCSHCPVVMAAHKAMTPIQRLGELADQDDKGDLVTYRCPTCSSCKKCTSDPYITNSTNTEDFSDSGLVHVDTTATLEHLTMSHGKGPSCGPLQTVMGGVYSLVSRWRSVFKKMDTFALYSADYLKKNIQYHE